jgi:RNA 3'-terminal phosphate cyclase (ATP)
MLTIDGSAGEGGGQILRTALALSLVTGRAFRIEKIRAGREKPGLLRQHLTAVNAAAQVGRAEVSGAAIGSREVVFHPGGIAPGNHSFAVGTAGSTTLVLQTILPALLTAPEPSTITLEGGTHNAYAPPFDFLARAFLPLLGRMGPTIAATLERPGFYPAGGGKFSIRVAPSVRLGRIDVRERGEIRFRRARAVVAGLPRGIAERELEIIARKMSFGPECLEIVEAPRSCGPGNIVTIELESEHVTEVFTGFGERGVAAERVASKAVDEAREYVAAGVPIGAHLADQLLVPMALAGGGSFRTLPLTRHSTTNLDVIRRFLETRFEVSRVAEHVCQVEIEGR